MRTKGSLLLLSVLSTSVLISCSSSIGGASSANDGIRPNTGMNRPIGNAPRGGRIGRSGSGIQFGSGTRFGSGARFGSGGNTMVNELSPEDQAIFTQMMNARRNGDIQLADQLQAQLQQKYPTMMFGKRSPVGSGATTSSSGSSGSSN